jgi:hypothetical protein
MAWVRLTRSTASRFVIWPPADRYVGAGVRAGYWAGWPLDGLSNVLAFVDPDTGFETKTRDGEKWVRHSEVQRLLHAPECGGVIVYQHRRQRERWDSVFAKLCPRLGYAAFAAAVFESNLAFVMLARTEEVAARLDAAARTYKDNHGAVHYRVLDPRSGEPLPHPPSARTGHREPRACECGCGGPTKSRFMPGHDSILRACFRFAIVPVFGRTSLVLQAWRQPEHPKQRDDVFRRQR